METKIFLSDVGLLVSGRVLSVSWKVGSISSEQKWPLLSHSPRAEPTVLLIVSSGILRDDSKTEYFKTEQRMKKVSNPCTGHKTGLGRENLKEGREEKRKKRNRRGREKRGKERRKEKGEKAQT